MYSFNISDWMPNSDLLVKSFVNRVHDLESVCGWICKLNMCTFNISDDSIADGKLRSLTKYMCTFTLQIFANRVHNLGQLLRQQKMWTTIKASGHCVLKGIWNVYYVIVYSVYYIIVYNVYYVIVCNV